MSFLIAIEWTKMISITRQLILYLIIFFLSYAVISKIRFFDDFNVQVRQSFKLLEWRLNARLYTVAFLVLNTLTILLLCIQKKIGIGLILALNTFSIPVLYILIMKFISKHIPCSCISIIPQLGWTGHLILNFFFIFLTIFLIITYKKTEYQ